MLYHCSDVCITNGYIQCVSETGFAAKGLSERLMQCVSSRLFAAVVEM